MTECGTIDCNAKAAVRAFWPGREPLPQCPACIDRALRIATAMGFHLHVEAIEKKVQGD